MTYSFTPAVSSKSCQARVSYIRTHFKNMHETAMAVKGMKLEKAFEYLTAVIDHKRCVPFRRFNGSIGRTGQGKEWKTDRGRWPEKSVKFLQTLLENAKSNAVAKGLDTEALVIQHVQVNQAPQLRRRTYRAHGRITPFKCSPCHVEVVLCEEAKAVAREKTETKRPLSSMQMKRLLRRQA